MSRLRSFHIEERLFFADFDVSLKCLKQKNKSRKHAPTLTLLPLQNTNVIDLSLWTIAFSTHTVKHGDALRKIAQTLLDKGSRYTEIVKLNGLKSNVLYIGQVLKIPEK